MATTTAATTVTAPMSEAGASRSSTDEQHAPDSTTNLPSPPEDKPPPLPAFNPGWRFYVCFSALFVISLMAALDATSLSVALPVSFLRHFPPCRLGTYGLRTKKRDRALI